MMPCTEHAEDRGAREPPNRYRWVFGYAVEGDLRFISHHDTMRLFRRALARAAVPVRYSEGFNPHPRIAIPLPRPVGVASQAEAIVIETETPIDPEDVFRRLEDHTPSGLRFINVRRLEARELPRPDWVRYRLETGDRSPVDLEPRIRQLLESEVVLVERSDSKGDGLRRVDVRPYIIDLRLDGEAVEFTLRVTSAGSAKPAEIAGLLGYDAGSINHRIRRMEVRWRT